MTSPEMKGLKVSTLLDANLKCKNIANIVGISVATMECVTRARWEGKDIKRKEGSGKHSSVANGDFIDELVNRVASDPTKSIRQHAHELLCARDTVSMNLKLLGIKSSFRRKQQTETPEECPDGEDRLWRKYLHGQKISQEKKWPLACLGPRWYGGDLHYKVPTASYGPWKHCKWWQAHATDLFQQGWKVHRWRLLQASAVQGPALH